MIPAPKIKLTTGLLVMVALPPLILVHLLLPGLGGSGLQAINNNAVLFALSAFAAISLNRCIVDTRALNIPDGLELYIAGVFLILTSAFVAPTSAFYIPLGVAFWFSMYLALSQLETMATRRLILQLIVISGVIEALLGLAQVLGWVPEIAGSRLNSRGIPVGGIQQSNLFASYLCVSLGAYNWLMTDSATGKTERLTTWIMGASMALVVAMVILSGSRTGWFALCIVSILGTAGILTSQKKYLTTHWAGMFISGIVLAVMLTLLSGSDRVASKAHLESTRWTLYQQAATLVLEHPIRGVGYGNVEREYVESAAHAYATGQSENRPMSNYTHVHTGLLQWPLEGGILGLLGVLLIAFAAARQVGHLTPPIALSYMTFMAPLGLHFVTEFPLRQSLMHSWLLVAGAYCASGPGKTWSIPDAWRRPARILVVSVLGLGIPIFALNNLNTIYWTREMQKAPVDNAMKARNIIFPGPLSVQVDYAIGHGLFVAGMQGNNHALDSFIQWAQQETQQLPRIGLLKLLERAQTSANDQQGLAETKQRLAYYFPTQSPSDEGSE